MVLLLQAMIFFLSTLDWTGSGNGRIVRFSTINLPLLTQHPLETEIKNKQTNRRACQAAGGGGGGGRERRKGACLPFTKAFCLAFGVISWLFHVLSFYILEDHLAWGMVINRGNRVQHP